MWHWSLYQIQDGRGFLEHSIYIPHSLILILCWQVVNQLIYRRLAPFEQYLWECWSFLRQLRYVVLLAACSSHRCLRVDRTLCNVLTAGVHCFYSSMGSVLHWLCIHSWQCREKCCSFWKTRKNLSTIQLRLQWWLVSFIKILCTLSLLRVTCCRDWLRLYQPKKHTARVNAEFLVCKLKCIIVEQSVDIFLLV